MVFLKLFERICPPLAARLLQSVPTDTSLQQQRRAHLDRLHRQVADDLEKLFAKVGLKVAA